MQGSEQGSGQGSEAGKGIAAFWTWWASAAPAFDQALVAGSLDDDLRASLADHVSAIHGKLDWGLCAGSTARHCLHVSARGDLALRPLAERWRAEAAEPDEVWEYHPARQPRADGPRELSLAGIELRLAELTARWSIDRAREVLDVTLHHQLFDELDTTHRAHAAFVALDDLLGEDHVQLWVGHVELTTEVPSQAHPLAELRQAVVDLEQQAKGEHWVSRQGELDGSPMVVTVNRALKAVRHLALDQHARIDILLDDPNKLGLARGDEALELEKREAELRDELGLRAVFIGRETHRGHRVLHLHVADAEAVGDRIEAWKRRASGREVAVLIQPDPRWEVLRRWG